MKKNLPPYSLLVSNLDHKILKKNLVELFAKFNVTRAIVNIRFDRKSGQTYSLGTGGVGFLHEEDAVLAKKEMDGAVVHGKPIIVSYASSQEAVDLWRKPKEKKKDWQGRQHQTSSSSSLSHSGSPPYNSFSLSYSPGGSPPGSPPPAFTRLAHMANPTRYSPPPSSPPFQSFGFQEQGFQQPPPQYQPPPQVFQQEQHQPFQQQQYPQQQHQQQQHQQQQHQQQQHQQQQYPQLGQQQQGQQKQASISDLGSFLDVFVGQTQKKEKKIDILGSPLFIISCLTSRGNVGSSSLYAQENVPSLPVEISICCLNLRDAPSAPPQISYWLLDVASYIPESFKMESKYYSEKTHGILYGQIDAINDIEKVWREITSFIHKKRGQGEAQIIARQSSIVNLCLRWMAHMTKTPDLPPVQPVETALDLLLEAKGMAPQMSEMTICSAFGDLITHTNERRCKTHTKEHLMGKRCALADMYAIIDVFHRFAYQ